MDCPPAGQFPSWQLARLWVGQVTVLCQCSQLWELKPKFLLGWAWEVDHNVSLVRNKGDDVSFSSDTPETSGLTVLTQAKSLYTPVHLRSAAEPFLCVA